ncbi:hypothetical protein JCM6882_006499 [Rhodosporidiobolus microsporus]
MVSCQRCRQPIAPNSLPSSHSHPAPPHPPSPSHTTLEDSLAALSPSSYDLLSASERLPQPGSSTGGGGGASTAGRGRAGAAPPVPASLPPLYTAATRQPTPGSSTVQRLTVPPPPSSSSSSRPVGPTDSFVVLTQSVLAPSTASLPSQPPAPAAASSASDPTLDRSSSPSSSSSAPPSLTPHLSLLSTLSSLLSSTSSLSHPLCTECADVLLHLLGAELDEGKKERDRLVGFEREVGKKRDDARQAGLPTGEKAREALTKDILKLKKVESHAIAELKAVEARKVALADEKRALDEEEAELAREEAEFWTAHSHYLLRRSTLLDRSSTLAQRLASGQRELEKLQRTNVYNDAFCIGQEAGFGTINGLRLGRLPGSSVDWPELNAAWGLTSLLLLTIARKFGVIHSSPTAGGREADEFEGGWKLVPCGGFSRVERRDPRTGERGVWELYGSSTLSLHRVLQNRRFDHAMVGFLECLRQVVEYVTARDRAVRIPHAVNKDKIGDVSIKLQFGSDEAWTRALRHVLLDLKILLGRASL